MQISGSVLLDFFAGTIQLLGAIFGVLAALSIFSWERKKTLLNEAQAALDQSLIAFASISAHIVAQKIVQHVPIDTLRDPVQFESLVESLVSETEGNDRLLIVTLANVAREKRAQIIDMGRSKFVSIWILLAMLISSFGSVIALTGTLLVEETGIYYLAHFDFSSNLRYSLVNVSILVTSASCVLSVLSVFTGSVKK